MSQDRAHTSLTVHKRSVSKPFPVYLLLYVPLMDGLCQLLEFHVRHLHIKMDLFRGLVLIVAIVEILNHLNLVKFDQHL